MKNAGIIAALAVIFVAVFMTRVEKYPLGPSSTAEIDDLGIAEAYHDAATNKLILRTSQGWAEMSLDQVAETNRRFEYTVKPVSGNILHEQSIDPKSAPANLKSMKSVAVVTEKYANFGYYHYPPDGRAREDETVVAPVPEGYDMAIYRGEAEMLPDNRTFLKSYIVVTKQKQADGRCGYQFFFDPGVSTSISLGWPNGNILYLPAFLSICIALPLAFNDLRGAACWSLLGLALVLNAISWLLSFALAGFGHAFGNYDRAEAPFPLILSAGTLAILVAVKLSRSSPGSAEK